MTETPDAQTINAFNTSIIDEFRANGGKVGGQFAGANLLLLHTTGAKSGRPRVSPLAYFRIDGRLIIIGSFAGAPVSPAWVHNLRAHPGAHVEIGAGSGVQEFDVTAHELPRAERDELFAKVAAAAPGFAEYQSKTSRVIPLFELRPA
ncbi:deazaflavin-dependent nitroreductase family protein [Mycobacterium bohemicum DSM 44277]|uniref:Deazaflavin-dependent nitroreductase n=2 Tax=Mycobacterium bohemicum TaxID=56425 RepID=A0A1X1R9V4_MYCBE|nr:nitroreductase family deazaflavin-dependent oxidoreductase [Mycobacterium bohemicum]MCV6972653.1 nitroreductase family deazaflavin-dependent oxidoreductase [Mycobacterium bohemicum]ORV01808.1 deazaflavin-dependent nitroreductase [Mycobacterium bohemicum]CPR12291.1 deazaflavin-dependent nitroreductase family protein [Mycobacterium bohemicum DSM 44277]